MPRKCPCGKYANFNVPTEIRGIRCLKCKTDDMIDVVSKRCKCGKSQPSFNVPGGKKGVCCKICKTVDMINVMSNKCSCGKIPSFNVSGERIGMCCSKCKTEDMVDIVHNRCPCGNHQIYNVSGETKPICCKICKTCDMVDVVSKRCPCGTIPYFNVPGEKIGVCCSKCKNVGMVDVVHKRCPCGKIPSFNVPGETVGMTCMKCKTEGMIDVVNKVCSGYIKPCPVRTSLGRGNKYCMSCDPNDDRRKRYKLHEEAFFDYVKDKINVHKREYRVNFDQNDTSNKFARLDGIVFGDGIIVCIEVDENGHRDYECDEHRMHLVNGELLQLYPGHNIAWVRVNPSVKSAVIRNKRFEEVVDTTRDILKTCDTRVVYIGF
jgi:hypothetical protein